MSRHTDKIVMLLAGLAVFIFAASQMAGLLQIKRARTDCVGRAGKLVSQVEENEFESPKSDAAAYSGRVFLAWEDMPQSESLTEWDIHPKPIPYRP